MLTSGWADTLGRDLKFTRRVLAKNFAFTATAIITLALGLAASTVIYSVVDAVLLQPLGYQDSGDIYRVYTVDPAGLPRGKPRLRHGRRVCPIDLHPDGALAGLELRPLQRGANAPPDGLRAQELGHEQVGPVAPADLAERRLRHPGHGGQDEREGASGGERDREPRGRAAARGFLSGPDARVIGSRPHGSTQAKSSALCARSHRSL